MNVKLLGLYGIMVRNYLFILLGICLSHGLCRQSQAAEVNLKEAGTAVAGDCVEDIFSIEKPDITVPFLKLKRSEDKDLLSIAEFRALAIYRKFFDVASEAKVFVRELSAAFSKSSGLERLEGIKVIIDMGGDEDRLTLYFSPSRNPERRAALRLVLYSGEEMEAYWVCEKRF